MSNGPDEVETNPENVVPEHVDPLVHETGVPIAQYEVRAGPGYVAVQIRNLATGEMLEIGFSASESIDHMVALLKKGADIAWGKLPT